MPRKFDSTSLPQRRKINVHHPPAHLPAGRSSARSTRRRKLLGCRGRGFSSSFLLLASRSLPPSLSLLLLTRSPPSSLRRRAIRALIAAKKGKTVGRETERRGWAIENGYLLICRSLTIDPFRERSKR